MSDKRVFVILLVIFILSVALLVYAKTHIGQNFLNSF